MVTRIKNGNSLYSLNSLNCEIRQYEQQDTDYDTRTPKVDLVAMFPVTISFGVKDKFSPCKSCKGQVFHYPSNKFRGDCPEIDFPIGMAVMGKRSHANPTFAIYDTSKVRSIRLGKVGNVGPRGYQVTAMNTFSHTSNINCIRGLVKSNKSDTMEVRARDRAHGLIHNLAVA